MVVQERLATSVDPAKVGTVVNDVHSKLNCTRVAKVIDVERIGDVIEAVQRAKQAGLSIAIAGGRHAMGGQQFATNGVLLNMRGFNRIRHFDLATGIIEVEAGIEWPALMRGYHVLQQGAAQQWGIRQKQTGADRLSIGGAVAANIHGRGLTMQPFVQDILSLTVVDANGAVQTCSRTENAELFSLVVGGYGLFGVVVTVTLQLVPRHQLERVVVETTVDELIGHFSDRIADGYTYGDFQFAIANETEDFLYRGVFSCYRPVDDTLEIPSDQIRLDKADWEKLLYLSHTDKQAAYDYFVSFLFGNRRPTLLVRHTPIEHLPRRLSLEVGCPSRCNASCHRDDYRTLRATRSTRALSARCTGGFSAARCRSGLWDHPPDCARRDNFSCVGQS